MQAPAERWRHFNTTYRNILGRNILRAIGHLVATCCHMSSVANRTSALELAQLCRTNLIKQIQHHATSEESPKKTRALIAGANSVFCRVLV